MKIIEPFNSSIFASDSAIKIIFIIVGIKRLLKIKKNMTIEKKYLLYQNMDISQFQINKEKWTIPSMTKFIFNKLIILLYVSLLIVYCIYYNSVPELLIFILYIIVCCTSWLVSTRLFYKEFRIYKDQTWKGIRIFWILNSLIKIIELGWKIYGIIQDVEEFLTNKGELIYFILYSTICFISFILFFLAKFHPYDVSIEKKDEDEENIINEDRNDTRISTEIKDELVNNSEEEFTNEEDLSYHNIEALKIELDDSEGFNKKEFNIELKIKTQDFKQLIFTLKIEKVKHKRVKVPIHVSNFNEVILKNYKNKNISKDLINLLKQAYNMSLTLNPQRTSFSADKKNTNLLAYLYREIIKKDYRFLLDLLKFLKIRSEDLIKCLSANYTSIYEEKPSVEKEIERIDTLGSIFDKFDDIGFKDINNDYIKKQRTDKKIKNKTKDFEEEEVNSSISSAIPRKKRNFVQEDYKSFSSFINNILINKRFITVQIISYENISENLNFLIKTINSKKEIFLQLNKDIIHDILYDDELSSFIIDYSENVNEMSKEKQTMEKLFNSYLNNVFYYDEKLFNLFNIHQLMHLDINKFNNEIIIKFFEDHSSNKESFKDDIRLYKFEIKFKIYKDINDIAPLINDGEIEISLSKEQDGKILNNNKTIKSIINIIKLYLILEKMVFDLNNNINKYSELTVMLNNSKIYSGKLLTLLYNISEEQLKNIKNYRTKEVLYGDNKINAIVLEFKKRFINNKLQITKINQEKINDINKEINNLNASFNSLLNQSNLKYSLYFPSFRDLLEFSNLFP